MTTRQSQIHHRRLAGAAWLAKAETQVVLASLAAQGHAARVVGGTVRDALIGRSISDIDIATTATPEQTIAAAQAAHLKTIPTGIDHGTVTVMVNHTAHEVTTLRRDIATDGRRATVAFTTNWREDALRRDFTINALFCDGAGTVYDFTDGMSDLAARRVRFIGDARQRIREDYLRTLRFFRFSAELSAGRLDAEGLAACDAERAGIGQLSAERIRVELLKLLVADAVMPIVDAMQTHGYLTPILGLVAAPSGLERLIGIEQAVGYPPDPMLRLAALAVQTREDALRLGARLRLSRDEIKALEFAATSALLVGDAVAPSDAKSALYRQGAAAFRAATLTAWARSGAAPSNRAWREQLTLPERWSRPTFPVSGNDLMAEGMTADARLGAMLSRLEDWWIARDFAPGREELLAEARRRLALD